MACIGNSVEKRAKRSFADLLAVMHALRELLLQHLLPLININPILFRRHTLLGQHNSYATNPNA